jgi:hypothetical protein
MVDIGSERTDWIRLAMAGVAQLPGRLGPTEVSGKVSDLCGSCTQSSGK